LRTLELGKEAVEEAASSAGVDESACLAFQYAKTTLQKVM
jgi:hypothetical protein